MPQTPIAFIAIDWGTTNARAYGLGTSGEITARREAALGILNVGENQFVAAFDSLVGDWRTDEPLPVLMSGMIGSRQGWVEADYVDCPADLSSLAQHLMPVGERENVAIVPGVCLPAGAAHRDVMRGEEVQCFGALQVSEQRDAVICLPGTHSKWVDMSEGRLAGFATSMTGEAYSVMRGHSILGALMSGDGAEDPGPAFKAGLARSGEPGGLLHHVFSVRADGLFDVLPADGLADYLSGILIGHEIRAMAEMFKPSDPVLVVGGGALMGRYAAAFDHLGPAIKAIDSERATVAGLAAVRRLSTAQGRDTT